MNHQSDCSTHNEPAMRNGSCDCVTEPFTCPACQKGFGYGADAVLLSIFKSAPFDENLPCCGVRVKGTVTLNNRDFMEIESITIVKDAK